MKFVYLFLVLFGVVLCEQYTTKFDNINIDEILGSDRLLNNYFNCLLNKGPCSPDGDELKKVLPDAIQTNCAKCSDKQKESVKKIIKFLVEKKPDMWKDLTGKYDPEGIYFEKYKSELGL
ncbi:ejaculatory bulb-specific protein 3-like [Zophobas morio]|uniref:ejaculatory bulb-specific protein 3-like n=1 Tax=Zophobas morio TaxID=2755281 RepID=UPI0030829163